MQSTYKGFNLLCIPLLTLLLLVTACEDPGSVGGDFVDNSELTFDTLAITNIETEEFRGYTGRLNHVTMGSYTDPLFGELNAIAMLKPTLDASLPEGQTLDGDYSMKLELMLDSLNTYGDTLSVASYTIYEITSQWNVETQRFDSEITYDEAQTVGTFAVNPNEDVVDVSLSNEWRGTFAEYFNNDADSAYRYENFGLAIVPNEGTEKISYIDVAASRFLAINRNTQDTTNFSIRESAYTLSRNGEIIGEEFTPIHSTLESVIKIDFTEYISAFEGENFIGAELVFHEAETELNDLPANHFRTEVSELRLDVGYEEDPAYELQLENPYPNSLGSKSDNIFRINLVTYINNAVYGSEEGRVLYIGSSSNAGKLQSTLLYNETAPQNLRPKLIITSLTEGE